MALQVLTVSNRRPQSHFSGLTLYPHISRELDTTAGQHQNRYHVKMLMYKIDNLFNHNSIIHNIHTKIIL